MARSLTFALFICLALACDPIESEPSSEPAKPVCTASYQGPTGTSAAGTCEIIYEQRCRDGNEYMADENCQYALSSDDAAACPYCPARQQPTTPGYGGGSSTSCNSSGVAYGCSEYAPYTCDESYECFESYSDCVNTPPCTY